MTIADKLLTLKDDFDRVFEAGKAKGDAAWADKVYVDTVRFDERNNFTLSLPFVPDTVYLFCYDALVLSTPLSYNMILYERSFGKYGAQIGYVNSGLTLSVVSMQNKSVGSYFVFGNGSLTYVTPAVADLQQSLFKDRPYFVFAYRTGLSERELLQNEVDSLGSGGGSVSFSQKRVLDTVSEAEWKSMIAAKQSVGWTFTLI